MTTHRAPKQWCLTKVETVNTFENWKENLKYVLSLDANFAPFLANDFQWEKRSRAVPNRGFTDDPATVPVANRKTAAQKVTLLELMLGQIANYCPVISRNTIVKNSTSIESIWQYIRAHYGFQSSGGHFLDFADIKLEVGERPEDLFQRLTAFVEDSLLTPNCGISHHGEPLAEEEELTPTLENMIVLMWLKLTHPELPRLVKQRYGTELRSRTLASIKPEISQALDTLLDELHHTEETRVMRTYNPSNNTKRRLPTHADSRRNDNRRTPRRASCPLCKQVGRPDTAHYLSSCPFLPETDKRYMTRARLIAAFDELECDDYDSTTTDIDIADEPSHTRRIDATPSDSVDTVSSRRVKTDQSPFITAYHGHHPVKLILDSGSETNMIKESTAHLLQATIYKSSQHALQADGKSPLHIKGETRLTLTRGKHSFQLEALVVQQLDVDILAGVPFMDVNDITIRPSKRQVILNDNTVIEYASNNRSHTPHAVRYISSHILRTTASTTVLPGEFLEVDAPSCLPGDMLYAIEPRADTKHALSWPAPDMIHSVEGKLRIPNHSKEPLHFKRNEHLAQAIEVFEPPLESAPLATNICVQAVTSPTASLHSAPVQIDPDHILPDSYSNRFKQLHAQYDEVFDVNFPGYNGAVGPLKAVVNMGPVLPPQRKGRLPQYSRNKLHELQAEFDRLESLGVFVRPADANIVAEYLNPSFLVKKPSGGHRLVTAFTEVGTYSKPQQSLMPNVDSTLRQIAC